MNKWLRQDSKTGKWHLARNQLVTFCGFPVVHAYHHHDGDSPPNDRYDVCLHCLRALEMRQRESEDNE